MNALTKTVSKAFSEVFDLDESDFSRDLTPKDLAQWDSIGHLCLVKSLERMLSIELGAEDVIEMDSVENIIEILENHTNPQ